MPERSQDKSLSHITPAQWLHLELMKLASFNHFEGKKVVDDLLALPHLWRSAMMGNFGKSLDLLALRDMDKGVYLVDTLMLITTDWHANDLKGLAHRWNPDEVWWLTRKETSQNLGVSRPGRLRILRVWWG